MKIGRMLSVVGVAASLAFASTASAKVVSAVWTCNSDGFYHVVFTYDNGSGGEWIYGECGPGIAIGHGFKLSFSEKTMVTPNGQAFLNSLEKRGAIAARRVSAQAARASRAPSARMETIQLRQSDVGPQLAAFLTGIDADWRKEGAGETKVYSIFDRWGDLSAARGPQLLVPGDMGLIVPAKGEGRDKRNSKERCLDKHGFWRNTGGEWGCWTSK